MLVRIQCDYLIRFINKPYDQDKAFLHCVAEELVLNSTTKHHLDDDVSRHHTRRNKSKGL